MIAVIVIVLLGIALIALMFMAHQAHMKNREVFGYIMAMIFLGYLLFMVAMMADIGPK